MECRYCNDTRLPEEIIQLNCKHNCCKFCLKKFFETSCNKGFYDITTEYGFPCIS